MAEVAFTSHLKRYFPDLQAGEVPGDTVRAIVDALDARHPGIASYLCDDRGRLRMHVNVFVGEEPIGDRVGLSDPVPPDGRVFIAQALSGG